MKLFLHLIFLSVCLNSCNFLKESAHEISAIDYNNRIIVEDENINEIFQKTNEDDLSEEENDSLSQIFLNTCDNSIEKLSKISSFNGDNTLKLAMLNYIKSFKSIYKNDFQYIDSVYYSDTEMSEDEINKLGQLEEKFNLKLETEQNKLEKIHKAFAKKHKFELPS